MPSTGNQNRGPQTFAEATTTGIDLTYARGCDFWRPFVILTEWRVRARPAPESDPLRRHGPELGSTGGGGRPRSFPSGPPLSSGIRRASRDMMIPNDSPSTDEPQRPTPAEPASAAARGAHLDSDHG